MSIKSLLSTTVTATESTVSGLIGAGNIVGDGLTWIARQSNNLNNKEVIRNEQAAFQLDVARERARLLKEAKKLNLATVQEEFKALELVLELNQEEKEDTE